MPQDKFAKSATAIHDGIRAIQLKWSVLFISVPLHSDWPQQPHCVSENNVSSRALRRLAIHRYSRQSAFLRFPLLTVYTIGIYHLSRVAIPQWLVARKQRSVDITKLTSAVRCVWITDQITQLDCNNINECVLCCITKRKISQHSRDLLYFKCSQLCTLM